MFFIELTTTSLAFKTLHDHFESHFQSSHKNDVCPEIMDILSLPFSVSFVLMPQILFFLIENL